MVRLLPPGFARRAKRRERLRTQNRGGDRSTYSRPAGALSGGRGYVSLQLAESHLTQRLFGQTLGRLERLARHPT